MSDIKDHDWFTEHRSRPLPPKHKYAPGDLGSKEKVQWERKEDIPTGMKRGADYSDRLYQWDWKKYNTLCEKHFGDRGQWFSQRAPKKIEAFLREYHGFAILVLLYIVEGENLGNGYPYWVFGYAYVERGT